MIFAGLLEAALRSRFTKTLTGLAGYAFFQAWPTSKARKGLLQANAEQDVQLKSNYKSSQSCEENNKRGLTETRGPLGRPLDLVRACRDVYRLFRLILQVQIDPRVYDVQEDLYCRLRRAA